jgi:multiple sugar transport system permease protein
MFQPDYSVVNGLLRLLGIKGPIWLQSPLTARIAVITADVWQWTPFFTVIMLSGLLNLPKEILEAGEIAGATWFQSLRLIVVPMMSPLILVTLLLRLIDSFRVFDSIFVMTNGGPGSSTEALSLYIYRTGLPYTEMGYASAMSYLFVIVLIIITTLLIRHLRGRQMEQ